MTDYSKFLEVALIAAKEGGKTALNYYGKVCATNKQLDGVDFNPVTCADIEAEKIMAQIILKEFPSHCIIGEECGSNNASSEYSWYIDPIDGTNNYSREVSNWGVMIGLCHNDEPVVNVIYTPISGDVFYAAKGQGSFKNGEKIHVSKIEKLSEASTECPGYLRGENRLAVIEFFKKFLPVIRSYRHFGASALAFPMLACGKLDLNLAKYYLLHDIVPGITLVREAGGVAIDFEGNEWTVKSNGVIVASTMKLALEALDCLKDNN